MEVRLIAFTQNPDLLCATAAQSTVSEKPAHELNIDETKASRIIPSVMDSGHHSVIEHASFTFSVSGVSRALTHQLVRHRIASYSQQSQRYVQFSGEAYVTPPTITTSSEATEIFKSSMDASFTAYQRLLQAGIPAEDARFVIPNAAHTSIVVTMNARELIHFFKLRCCTRAQWEIRWLADAMLAEARKAAPIIFARSGASCDTLGYCPERTSCGRKQTLKEMLKATIPAERQVPTEKPQSS